MAAGGVSVDIDGHRIVADAALAAEPGTLVGLIGPNGSGKSTLLRTVYRALRPVAGRILLDAEDVWSLSPRDSARRTAVVLQDDTGEFAFSVREVVELGRVPHRGLLDHGRAADAGIVERALADTGVVHLADRMVATLSGGERQRVFLARALAQEPRLLVLDEPTNHLDVRAQIELLEMLSDLPVTVVAALHDLNLAAAYCDRVHVLADGQPVAEGPADEVLTPELIRAVYGVDARCTTNPLTGRRAVHLAALTPEPHVLEDHP
ncbi:ABC transporter ATP-binding protein [Pseudonocardia pini]|uniref:ABC transporter ATP-binding protein n=1 Tax=Pseudonocardia pini TaxID=2758030 RepID=UPI0028AEECAD|nr:ABC transporter ATP-binding protein [Pseudonocardia pini]